MNPKKEIKKKNRAKKIHTNLNNPSGGSHNLENCTVNNKKLWPLRSKNLSNQRGH